MAASSAFLHGSLQLVAVQAKLFVDVSGLLTSMDPFVHVTTFNDESSLIFKANSDVCKGGGKTPTWNFKVDIPLDGSTQYLALDVCDKTMLGSNAIGRLKLNLTKAPSSTEPHWYKLLDDKGKHVGQLELGITFDPFSNDHSHRQMEGRGQSVHGMNAIAQAQAPQSQVQEQQQVQAQGPPHPVTADGGQCSSCYTPLYPSKSSTASTVQCPNCHNTEMVLSGGAAKDAIQEWEKVMEQVQRQAQNQMQAEAEMQDPSYSKSSLSVPHSPPAYDHGNRDQQHSYQPQNQPQIELQSRHQQPQQSQQQQAYYPQPAQPQQHQNYYSQPAQPQQPQYNGSQYQQQYGNSQGAPGQQYGNPQQAGVYTPPASQVMQPGYGQYAAPPQYQQQGVRPPSQAGGIRFTSASPLPTPMAVPVPQMYVAQQPAIIMQQPVMYPGQTVMYGTQPMGMQMGAMQMGGMQMGAMQMGPQGMQMGMPPQTSYGAAPVDAATFRMLKPNYRW